MTTSVIVPCWNAAALTRVCLDRLLRLTSSPFELVLVDNGSAPAAARLLVRSAAAARARRLVRRCVLVRHERNLGYPAGMNAGLARASSQLVVLGNADAAVTQGWLEGMRAAFEDARVGGAAPATNPPRRGTARPWADPPRYAGLAGLDRFAAALSLRPEPAFREARGFVPGFWFMVRRAALEGVGVFDERFSPGGYEDWDLQWRLREAGWKVGFSPRAFVHHAGSGCARANGLSPRELFGPRRRALLTRKHPRTKGLALEALCP